MVSKLLYFGSITNKFIFPILSTLCSVVFAINDCLIEKFDANKDKNNIPKYGQHAFIYFFTMFFSEAFSLFIYCIQQKISPRSTYAPNKPIQNDKTTISFGIICIIIIAALSDLSSCILDWSTLVSSNIYDNIFTGVFILFVVGLCVLILHIKYYKHHALAIGVIFIGLAIDSIVNREIKSKMNINLYIFLMILCKLFEAMQDVIEKYAMENYTLILF